MRGLKRQLVAALTNFVGCFFSLYLLSFFSSLALNDLAGPSAGPLARKTYSIPFHSGSSSCGGAEGVCAASGSPSRVLVLYDFHCWLGVIFLV